MFDWTEIMCRLGGITVPVDFYTESVENLDLDLDIYLHVARSIYLDLARNLLVDLDLATVR